MADSISVRFVSNDGDGVSKQLSIRPGTTVGDLFRTQMAG